jgi:hypothetical protein
MMILVSRFVEFSPWRRAIKAKSLVLLKSFFGTIRLSINSRQTCVFYRNISSTANPSSPRVQTLAADLSFATGIRFNN